MRVRACCVEVEGASERARSEAALAGGGRGRGRSLSTAAPLLGGCCLCLLLQLQRPLAICRRRCRSLLPLPLLRPPTSPLFRLLLRPRDRSVADDEGKRASERRRISSLRNEEDDGAEGGSDGTSADFADIRRILCGEGEEGCEHCVCVGADVRGVLRSPILRVVPS